MSETDTSRAIQDALKAGGFWVLRLQSGKVKVRGAWMRLCPEGTPDLLVLRPLTFLEIKRDEKSKPSPAQLRWHERAKREGVPVYVVSNVQEAFRAVDAERQFG